ncbi:hypothetical protein E4T49_08147 [Aureobasidium sp. EXF-10728]|nr:hypothetical protein E4T49_08147 [Aureobasidium sp. EXF-10728]
MPPISSLFPVGELLSRNVTTTDGSSPGLHVVCAWPVSGQYGPGSRVLYYVLVVLCVFGKKADWIKNACLAAVLLFPAVAALHGITLAALHVNGAVDMDIYGAFQLCSLGILAAPATVKNSRTYFLDPGRNIIFLWTILILSVRALRCEGLLSLAVEFFRTKTQVCKSNTGSLVSLTNFSYGVTDCGLVCSVDSGPESPMRRDAANNIYVIPAPTRLTFGTVTLLCAACCIPAILTLISMWNKILEINWKSRYGRETEKDPEEKKVKDINSLIKRLLNVIEAPLFGVAVVVILILGEINLFSEQVRYQTEPIASIGQWAPIVGTGLAMMGSLVVYVTSTSTESETESVTGQAHDGTDDNSVSNSSRPESVRPDTHDSNHSRIKSNALTHVNTAGTGLTDRPADRGGRRKVSDFLHKVGDYMGTPGKGRFDNPSSRRDYHNYPTIPGQEFRDGDLTNTERRYTSGRLSRSASRASDMRIAISPSDDHTQRRSRSDSMGARSIDSQEPVSPLAYATPALTTRDRSNTLEVPTPAHLSTR